MLSKAVWKYLFAIFRRAHNTYQCPLTWDYENKNYKLDNSIQFWIMARIVLVDDLFTILLATTVALYNYYANLNYVITLLAVFTIGFQAQNICLDMIVILWSKPWQQLVNSFLQLTKWNKGILGGNMFWSNLQYCFSF